MWFLLPPQAIGKVLKASNHKETPQKWGLREPSLLLPVHAAKGYHPGRNHCGHG